MLESPRQFLSRLIARLHPRRWEREFDEELEAHLALLIEEYRRQGLPPEEAGRRARVKLGGSEQLRECRREQRRRLWGGDFLRDLRQSRRLLRRNPAFAVVALVTLALGLGAATILFSLIQRELWQPLPYPHASRLVAISLRYRTDSRQGVSSLVNAGMFQIWQRQATHFQHMSLLEARGLILTGRGRAQIIPAARVSANFFRTLGAPLRLGRAFTPAEELQGQDHEVILAWPLWRRLFSASAASLGARLVLNGTLYTVVGVLPRGFYLPRLGRLAGQFGSSQATPPIQMFFPLGLAGWETHLCICDQNFIALGRLRPGISPVAAGRQLDLINRRILASLHESKIHTQTFLTPLQRVLTAPYRSGLLLIAIGAGLLLLLIALNLANLLLARNSGRLHEMAVRSAVGAGRGRLLRQLLSEMVWLLAAGFALGLLLAWAGLRLLAADTAIGLPRLGGLHLTPAGWAFAGVVTLLAGALFILPPTLHLLRQAAPESLQVSQSTIASHRHSLHLREWLSGTEIALSALLLTTALLLAASLRQVLRVNRALDTHRVLTLKVVAPLSHGRLAQADAQRLQFFRQVLDRVRRLGDVRAAGWISQLPLEGQTWTSGIQFFGLPARPRHEGNFRFISPDYFRAAGIPLVAGTTLPPDRADVAIISENVVRQVLGGRNPIGMKIMESGEQHVWLRVVGVAADVRADPEKPAPLMIYQPMQDWPGIDYSLVVRTAGNWRRLAGSLPPLIWSLDSNEPLPPAAALSHLVSAATHTRRFQAQLAGAYALAAALLAALGLYGVLSASVVLRRHEIAIRMALGADADAIRRLVLRHTLRLLGFGLTSGLLLAALLASSLSSLLYQVSPMNPSIYLAVALGLSVIALAAGAWPARQAGRLDPARLLHAE